MLEAWISGLLLAMESSDVVRLRLFKMAGGGCEAYSEAALMVNEKVAAAFEAQRSLLGGGTVGSVVERYREHVAANAKRLAV